MSFLLSIAKFILAVYFILYALIHICLFITPQTANVMVFMTYGYFMFLLFVFFSYYLKVSFLS